MTSYLKTKSLTRIFERRIRIKLGSSTGNCRRERFSSIVSETMFLITSVRVREAWMISSASIEGSVAWMTKEKLRGT